MDNKLVGQVRGRRVDMAFRGPTCANVWTMYSNYQATMLGVVRGREESRDVQVHT